MHGFRNSYDFEGNSETLDHILTSQHLAPTSVLQPMHVNAEFADKASDHDPMLARITLPPGSLRLDGSTGYAEAPSSPDLNLTGDWDRRSVVQGRGSQRLQPRPGWTPRAGTTSR